MIKTISNEGLFGGNDKVIYNNAGVSSSVYNKLDNIGKIKVAFVALNKLLGQNEFETMKIVKVRIYELLEQENVIKTKSNGLDVNIGLVRLVSEGMNANYYSNVFHKGDIRAFGNEVQPFKEFKDIRRAVMDGDHVWLLDFTNKMFRKYAVELRQIFDNGPTQQALSELVVGNYLSPCIVLDCVFDGCLMTLFNSIRNHDKEDFGIKPFGYIDFIVGTFIEFTMDPVKYLNLVKKK